jgi:hypothetical protein
MAPLQKLAVKPIEDPAEQAALDERLKRSQEAASVAHVQGGVPSKATALSVLELCRALSAEGRLLVATELMAQLSLDERIKFMERLTAELPPEAIRRLEEEWRGRVGGGVDGSGVDGTGGG